MTNKQKTLELAQQAIDPSLKGKTFITVILALFIVNMLLPQMGRAEPVYSANFTGGYTNEVVIKSESVDLITLAYLDKVSQLPTIKPVNIRTMYVESTAYSSDVWQTDSTPCITADGYNVCEANQENIIAANFLPFGTKVRVPELYGNKVFYVHDRMHSRFGHRVDFWKKERQTAINYGYKYIKIEILN